MKEFGRKNALALIAFYVLFDDYSSFSSNAYAFAFRTTAKGSSVIRRSRSTARYVLQKSAPVMKDDVIQTTTTSISSSISSSSSSNSNSNNPTFKNFDYEDHWYPCVWEEDLELDVPTKVTIFDVDYVVSKTPSGDAVAMKDYCTHKGAALSEGRMTASGYFQCAYHGWSFDGATGDCVEIPQIVFQKTKNDDETTTGDKVQLQSATIPSRACANHAVPAQIHQGMVWLFPGGGLEKALLAPPPPSVPEELFSNHSSSLKMTTVVRDMPIDFPILLSNICDPDHGLFAHQSTAFDMYTASLDCGFESFVSEEIDGGKGWSLRTKIDAKDKILELDRSLRRETTKSKSKPRSKKSKGKQEPKSPWATFWFYAPTHVRMNRVNKETGETKLVTTFYVCPVGVGRSRFMSAVLSGFKIPRWLIIFSVNNFLDQDTYLLATQQRRLLAQEADDLRAAMKENGIDDRNDAERIKGLKLKTRTRSFVLPSPTDKVSARLEQFWDATLTRCPNRAKHLLNLDESGAFLQTPSREFVLDRKTQSLDISKDSRDVVRNCKRTKRLSRILSIALALGKMTCMMITKTATTTTTTQPLAFVNFVFKTSFLVPALTCLSLASSLAGKLEREYYFKYTDKYRRADMKKIPEKIWLDK
jgi:phenylpropionate dioxygenase-like ring-hydroxylating dioxygenase large terminal subunit